LGFDYFGEFEGGAEGFAHFCVLAVVEANSIQDVLVGETVQGPEKDD